MTNFNNLPPMQDARVAIQKEGRMTEGSIEWLNENTGTNFPITARPFAGNPRRQLTDTATGITILGRSNGDNLKAVACDEADLTICGSDKYGEVLDRDNLFGLKALSPLGFATCRLVFARQFDTEDNMRTVATSYPRQARRYLDERGMNVPVSYYAGGTEMIAEENGYNLVEIVVSGESLEATNFEEIETISESEALLIGIEAPLTRDPEVYDLLSRGGSIGNLLTRRLDARRQQPTGSLASRVVNDPTGNLGLKKLSEEGAEVVAALVGGDRKSSVTELADLTFWLIANGVRVDIPNAEVDRELVMRYIEGSSS